MLNSHSQVEVSKPGPEQHSPESAVRRHLSHRGGLGSSMARLRPEPGLIDRIGGQEALERVVDRLYIRIADDPELRPLFGDRVHGEHRMQKFFFVEWAGGMPRYREDGTSHGMYLLHYRFGLDRPKVSRWLQHLVTAMREEGLSKSVVMEVAQILGPMAHGLRHQDGPPLPPDLRRADVEEWRRYLEGDPDFFERHQGEGRRAMFRAAERGDVAKIDFLAEAGVSVDVPLMRDDLMHTPWCAAVAGGHGECADLLQRLGAQVDVFSLAFLGRRSELSALLDETPGLLQVEDPAMDLRGITLVHHAIRGKRPETALDLLNRGLELGPDSAQLLRLAADAAWAEEQEAGDSESWSRLVSVLLARGASANDIGPGDWVKHDDVCEALVQAGADVNRPAGAWLHFCTSRFGRRDDPELIGRLLDLGADTAARDHTSGPLHLAAAAGHVGILRRLLDAGLDVNEPDGEGEPPLAHLAWAVRSADRVAVAELLLSCGARLDLTGSQGLTVHQRLARGNRRDQDELLAMLSRFGKESPG